MAKFTYDLAVQYSGKKDIDRFRADLSAVGKIDSMRRLGQDAVSLARGLETAKRKMREDRKAAKDAGGAQKELNAAYDASVKKVQALSDALGKKKAQTSAARKELKQLGVDTNKLNSEVRRLSSSVAADGKAIAARNKLGIRSSRDIRNEIRQMSLAYRDLRKSGLSSSSDIIRAQARWKEETKKLKAELKGLQEDGGLFAKGGAALRGGLAAVFAGAGLKAGFSEAVQAFAQFDDIMRAVRAVSGAAAEDMALLDAEAKRLGATTRFSAMEAGEAMLELAQSGFTASQTMDALGEVLNFASASGLTLSESAAILTATLSQFGLEAKDTKYASDIIVNGFTSSSTSAAQFALAMGYVGPIAKDVGWTLEQTAAAIDVMAKAGFRGEKGGTALRGGIGALIRPTRRALEILQKYNIVINDATGKMRPFADIIDDIGASAITSGEKLKVFGLESGPGMNAAIRMTGDTLRAFEQDMLNSAGTAEKIASEKEGGIGGSFRGLTSAIEGAAIALGSAWNDEVKAAVDLLSGLTRAATGLPEGLQKTVSVLVTGGSAWAVWNLGMKAMVAESTVLSAGLTAFTGKLAAARTALLSLSTVGVAAVAGGAVIINETVNAYGDLVDAEHKAVQSEGRFLESQERLRKKMRDVRKDTGLVFSSITDLNKAITAGTVRFDEASGKWVKSWGKAAVAAEEAADNTTGVTDKALKVATKQWARFEQELGSVGKKIQKRSIALKKALDSIRWGEASQDDVFSDLEFSAEDALATVKALSEETKKAFAAGDIVSGKNLGAMAETAADEAIRAYAKLAEAAGDAFDAAALDAEDSAGRQKKSIADSLNILATEYKKYAQIAKDATGEVISREEALAAQLLELKRSTMDDADAWESRRDEAEKFASAAKKAVAAARSFGITGDFEAANKSLNEAIRLSDKAREGYAGLNAEVKRGEDIFVTQEEAAAKASEGVEMSGKLAIEAAKLQAELANKVADSQKASYIEAAKEYNAAQEDIVAQAKRGAQEAGEAAIKVLRLQEEAIQKAKRTLDSSVGGALSKKADEEFGKIGKGIESLGDKWKDTWSNARDEFRDIANDVQRILDSLSTKKASFGDTAVEAMAPKAVQSSGATARGAFSAAGTAANDVREIRIKINSGPSVTALMRSSDADIFESGLREFEKKMNRRSY